MSRNNKEMPRHAKIIILETPRMLLRNRNEEKDAAQEKINTQIVFIELKSPP